MDIPKQPDATAHGKPEYASKELCCSKLYFCGHKTPFRTHKSNLPNAGASERLAAVSHRERWSGKPNRKCIQV